MMISRRFFMTSTLALMAGNMVFSGPAGARTGPDSYATMFEDLGQVPVWMFRQQQAFDIEWGDAEAITAAIGQNWAEDIPPAFARHGLVHTHVAKVGDLENLILKCKPLTV